jgi:hypothetical protein
MLGFITHSGIYRFIKHFCHWAAIPLLLYILVTVAFNVYFWGFVSLFLLHLSGGVLEIKESEVMWLFLGSGGLITGCFFLLTISPLGEGILRLRLGLLKIKPHEYQADHFAGTVGYAHALADALTAFDSGADAHQPLFALLASSHPPTKKRVARLRRFPRTSVGEESVIGAYEGEVMCEDTSICAQEETTPSFSKETTPSHSDEMTPALSDEIIL